jgi:hypothetical protein
MNNIAQIKPYNDVARIIIGKKDYVSCALILLLGVSLRLYHYASIPSHNWTADEYAFAWSGMRFD